MCQSILSCWRCYVFVVVTTSNNLFPLTTWIVGKWEMIEYAGGNVNALDTISFYENGKMDYPSETGEFTYHLIKSDSLIIYNRGFGEQHYKILKLSNDSLIKQIRRKNICKPHRRACK